MKKTQILNLILIVTIFTTFSTFSTAQGKKGGGPKASNPGAIVSFGYCATAGDNACETANRVRSDQNKPYTNGQEGIAAVFNVGSGSNDLTVNFSGSTRSITYDFREMAAVGNPTPVWIGTPQVVKPFINVLGAYNAKLTSGCSTAATCEFDYVTGMNAGSFTISKITYRLQWNPGSVQPYINTPETTAAVNVHYHKGTDGESFTITPLPNPHTARYIAGLQGETTRSVTAGGQYVMAFAMTVKVQ